MVTIINDIDLHGHEGEYDVTLVGTNLYCSMAQGYQLKVLLDHHFVFDMNMETKYGDMNKLGTILECQKEGEPMFCLCFITKGYNFRPDITSDYLEYDALEKCLKFVNIRYKGKNIATTLLGTSRFDGNGDREKVLDMFNTILTDCNVTVFDYFQPSRQEEMKAVRDNELEVKKVDRKAYYELVRKRKELAEERFKKNKHRRY